jgi:adenylosuccinate synthase
MGVTKAYCTRVGGGPFPTELENETGELLRKLGSEFGATTGRPRRCGWIDLVALQYACMINGVTKVIMTKADVLDSFEKLNVCTSYNINGENVTQIPFQMNRVQIEPQWKQFAGWHCDTTQWRKPNDLSKEMNEYVAFINQFIGAPVSFISNGPEREQVIPM